MAGALTAGLDPSFEYFRGERPEESAMRDSATLWFMDASGRLALPRVTFDAIGESWDTPWVQLNFVHADGRTMRVWSQQAGHCDTDLSGLAAVRTAGPLRIACVEPFAMWTMEFDGATTASTTADERAGLRHREPARLAFRLVAEMAAPPWLMGGLTAEAARQMKAGDGSLLMGGVRYEQLCRITGWIEIDGVRSPVAGAGMRVRRQGIRNMGAALGHCQHSALFPSGKAFGAIIMASGPDAPAAFNEAFLLSADGRKLPARVVEAPWMRTLSEADADASLVLESELGRARIAGKSLLSMYDHHDFEMAGTSVLHQGSALYSWDGEETIGLIERCTLRHLLKD